MREILFRGKRKNNGEWADGDLIKHGNDCFVIPFFGISNTEEQENKTCDTLVYLQAHRVDPETVCQYTGLTDKNGRKIFEGDIVSISLWNLSRDKVKHAGIVKYDISSFVVQWIGKKYSRFLRSFKGNDPFESPMSEIEIIGNILDNPELIGD